MGIYYMCQINNYNRLRVDTIKSLVNCTEKQCRLEPSFNVGATVLPPRGLGIEEEIIIGRVCGMFFFYFIDPNGGFIDISLL